MTCRQLGGACDLEFHANSFEEMENLSKEHGIEMYQKGDEDHITAMEKMWELMNNPKALEGWMESKRIEFESLT